MQKETLQHVSSRNYFERIVALGGFLNSCQQILSMSFGGLGNGSHYVWNIFYIKKNFWNIAAVNCAFIRKLCVGLAFQHYH